MAHQAYYIFNWCWVSWCVFSTSNFQSIGGVCMCKALLVRGWGAQVFLCMAFARPICSCLVPSWYILVLSGLRVVVHRLYFFMRYYISLSVFDGHVTTGVECCLSRLLLSQPQCLPPGIYLEIYFSYFVCGSSYVFYAIHIVLYLLALLKATKVS